MLLRRENKKTGDTETKCRAETEGKTETALPEDLSSTQSPNPDTIVDANKHLLTGA